MQVLVSDINQDCNTLDGKFICFTNKKELIKCEIEGDIKKRVYAVELATGKRILNPDFKVDVKPQFAY